MSPNNLEALSHRASPNALITFSGVLRNIVRSSLERGAAKDTESIKYLYDLADEYKRRAEDTIRRMDAG